SPTEAGNPPAVSCAELAALAAKPCSTWRSTGLLSSAFFSSALAPSTCLASPCLGSPESSFLVQAEPTSSEAVSNNVERPRVRIGATLHKPWWLGYRLGASKRELGLHRVDVVHAGRGGDLHVATRGLDLDALGHALELRGGLALGHVEQRLDLVGGGLGLVVGLEAGHELERDALAQVQRAGDRLDLGDLGAGQRGHPGELGRHRGDEP